VRLTQVTSTFHVKKQSNLTGKFWSLRDALVQCHLSKAIKTNHCGWQFSNGRHNSPACKSFAPLWTTFHVHNGISYLKPMPQTVASQSNTEAQNQKIINYHIVNKSQLTWNKCRQDQPRTSLVYQPTTSIPRIM